MLADRITGGLIGALGLLTIWGASQLPAMLGQPVGPSAFPTLIGAGLAGAGALIALGVGRSFEDGPKDKSNESLHEEASTLGLGRAAIPILLLVFYAYAVERLGFVPTAGVIVLVMALALGARLAAALMLALFVAPAAHLIFGKLLRVPLAPGLLPMPW